jgi:hypothetical protein
LPTFEQESGKSTPRAEFGRFGMVLALILQYPLQGSRHKGAVVAERLAIAAPSMWRVKRQGRLRRFSPRPAAPARGPAEPAFNHGKMRRGPTRIDDVSRVVSKLNDRTPADNFAAADGLTGVRHAAWYRGFFKV